MATQVVPERKVAPDPITIDPKHYTVEFENEKVRVLRIKYGPHEKSPMHRHPASVAVLLTPHHSRHTFSDGRVQDMHGKPGDVMYMDKTEHAPENANDSTMELIAVELKG
jgi:quercetin dioxygenase-like cupin family protein